MIFDDAILKLNKKRANFRLSSFHRVYFSLACMKVTLFEGKHKVKTQLTWQDLKTVCDAIFAIQDLWFNLSS